MGAVSDTPGRNARVGREASSPGVIAPASVTQWERVGRVAEAVTQLRNLHDFRRGCGDVESERAPSISATAAEQQRADALRIKDLIREAFSRSQITRAAACHACGISMRTLEAWLDRHDSTRHAPAWMLASMMRPGSGIIDESARRWLIRQVLTMAGVVDVLPVRETAPSVAVQVNLTVMHLQVDLGDVTRMAMSAVSAMSEGGNAMTRAEARAILNEADELVTRAIELRTGLQAIAGV